MACLEQKAATSPGAMLETLAATDMMPGKNPPWSVATKRRGYPCMKFRQRSDHAGAPHTMTFPYLERFGRREGVKRGYSVYRENRKLRAQLIAVASDQWNASSFSKLSTRCWARSATARSFGVFFLPITSVIRFCKSNNAPLLTTRWSPVAAGRRAGGGDIFIIITVCLAKYWHWHSIRSTARHMVPRGHPAACSHALEFNSI